MNINYNNYVAYKPAYYYTSSLIIIISSTTQKSLLAKHNDKEQIRFDNRLISIEIDNDLSPLSQLFS